MPLPDAIETVLSSNAEKLQHYVQLLTKWQGKINLVSNSTLNDVWQRHIIDSAQIYPHSAGRTLYDLGSGAGFPGMVLAILRPEMSVTLIESDQKKCSFLSTVSRETNSPVTILNMRIEDAVLTLPPPDIVTARALASLTDLFSYIEPWFKQNPDIKAIFPKGKAVEEEISEAKAKGWAFDISKQPSYTSLEASLLVVTNLSK